MNEEEKDLELLRFALYENSISDEDFCISTDNADTYAEDKVCLVKDAEFCWRVYYNEKGGVYDLAVHQTFYRACKDFYCRLTRCPSPWDYREKWEETGGKSKT
ncbi:MAG: hypothetical protein GXP05_05700 [Alphaproteobacteria bacterium]|nr:hypothetical protein [Alphaproteobacteria bacterium]